jgi:hypothetical protein
MTAIVGVLNKHAVAIAADSAVTLVGGRKVMNSATKLFALSKYHPVSIAVYGNAEFIGTPWEIIIKEYRNQLGSQSFPSLRQYVDNFQRFLRHKKYFCSEKEAKEYLKSSVKFLFISMLKLYKENPKHFDALIKRMDIATKQPLLGGFKQDTVDFFTKEVDKEITKGYKKLTDVGIDIKKEKLRNLIESVYTRDVVPIGTTGLVFAGYGENEFFPSIYNCNVGAVINGLLAKVVKTAAKINRNNPSAICPFAQTDVMHTILDGVAPKMQQVYMLSLEKTFSKVKDALASIIENTHADLASQIRNLDISPFGSEFLKMSRSVQMKEYTGPFVGSVVTLEKEDLADFAESLITLTSLKRKVSFDQETVGGPVDVMVISKGDGVIWMKKKEYFNSDLNPQYFNNYYNL